MLNRVERGHRSGHSNELEFGRRRRQLEHAAHVIHDSIPICVGNRICGDIPLCQPHRADIEAAAKGDP